MTNDTTTARPLVGELPADDPRFAVAKAVAVAGAVLGAVAPEQLELPTPCEGVDVHRLRCHLVMVLRRIAAAGRGLPLAEWPVEEDIAETAIAAEWDAAGHDVQAVWTDSSILDRPTTLPWTTISGAETLAIYANELVVHAWDLATATGQTVEWDPELLAVCDVAIHDQLPDADRRPMWDAVAASLPPGVPFEAPFANAVAVADDAPAIDRLVAWNGRQP